METKAFEGMAMMGQTELASHQKIRSPRLCQISSQQNGVSIITYIPEGETYYSAWLSDIIKAGVPWFFEMCSLISEHPNLVPTGIGNGNSAIDMNILLPGDIMMGADDPDEMAIPDEQSGSDKVENDVLLMVDEDIGIQEEKLAFKKEKSVILKKGPIVNPPRKQKCWQVCQHLPLVVKYTHMALTNKVQKHHGVILQGGKDWGGNCAEATQTEEIPGEEHKWCHHSEYPGKCAPEGGTRLTEGWVDDAKIKAGPCVLHGTVIDNESHLYTWTTANLAY